VSLKGRDGRTGGRTLNYYCTPTRLSGARTMNYAKAAQDTSTFLLTTIGKGKGKAVPAL